MNTEQLTALKYPDEGQPLDRDELETRIRDDLKSPRYEFATIPAQKRWGQEAENITDDIDVTELMMVAMSFYEGNGQYDELAIGNHLVGMIESGIESELDKL